MGTSGQCPPLFLSSLIVLFLSSLIVRPLMKQVVFVQHIQLPLLCSYAQLLTFIIVDF